MATSDNSQGPICHRCLQIQFDLIIHHVSIVEINRYLGDFLGFRPSTAIAVAPNQPRTASSIERAMPSPQPSERDAEGLRSRSGLWRRLAPIYPDAYLAWQGDKAASTP